MEAVVFSRPRRRRRIVDRRPFSATLSALLSIAAAVVAARAARASGSSEDGSSDDGGRRQDLGGAEGGISRGGFENRDYDGSGGGGGGAPGFDTVSVVCRVGREHCGTAESLSSLSLSGYRSAFPLPSPLCISFRGLMHSNPHLPQFPSLSHCSIAVSPRPT